MNSTPPDKPGNGDALGAPGSTASANISHSGATELSSSATVESPAYSSTAGGQNALLVTGGEVSISQISVTKSGDESSENSDFYGTNAAVLAMDGASLTLDGGEITTSGAHANALFSYGEGSAIIASNLKITTSKDNSGGIMVTGGAHLIATDLAVETSGNSSAPIRSDRGGGVMAITGGTYTSHGAGSPAIYSTANISTNSGTKLISTASEGIVIEGANSVTLFDSTLQDTNTVLHGNSETYKNIFIYQSMSGDASEGTGYFAAFNSLIETNAGDTFFITNTTAEIELSNNRIVNSDASSAFLRAQAGKWGTAGKNGGDVKLTLSSQVVEGDIVLDSISSLTMSLEGSHYMGAINSANSAASASVSLSSDSTLVLTGDTYLSSLTNADSSNQNIYSNGFTLYVAGVATAVNTGEAPALPEVALDLDSETTTGTDAIEGLDCGSSDCVEFNYTPLYVAGGALLVIILAILALVLKNRKKSDPSITIRNLSPSDNLSRAGDLLYQVDPYICPDFFGDIDRAHSIGPLLFKNDGSLFDFSHTLVAEKDGELLGILVYATNKITPWDCEAVKNSILSAGIPLPENFDRANVNYMKVVSDEAAQLPDGVAEVEWCSVEAGQRNLGIAQKLFDAFLKLPGISEAHLTVLADNPAAIHVYEKKGFKIVSSQTGYPDNSVKTYNMVRKG